MSENKKEETKVIHPEIDANNYLVQIVASDGKTIIKQIVVNNAMVRIQYLGKQSIALLTK